MKKMPRFLLPALAAALCLGAALHLLGPRPALLENAGLSADGTGSGPAGAENAGLTDIPEAEVPLAGAPEAETPPALAEAQRSAAQEVLELVNAARSDAGLAPLELDLTLCGAAQVRAEECVSFFSHTRPDGSAYRTAITQAGLSSSCTGENAATGHSSARQAADAWLQSEGHRANILNGRFTKLGVGMEPNRGNRYKGCAWVQLFMA